MIDIRQLVCNTSKAYIKGDREVRMRHADLQELSRQLAADPLPVFNGLPIVIDESAPALPRKGARA